MTPAHRIEVVLAEDGKLSLDELPFRAGQLVEVTVAPITSAAADGLSLHGKVIRYDRPTDPVAEDGVNEVTDSLDPDAVHDRESFFAFVSALADDRRASVAAEQVAPSSPYGPAAGGWENVTVERFLEAALSWALSTSMGVRQGLPPEPSWQAFASFLYCGKIYE